MYRLYVDEVGNDDLNHVDDENHRYLSLSGVVMDLQHARDFLTPEFNLIKAQVLDHDIDDPIIFHRKDIINFRQGFRHLRDEKKRSEFDASILKVIDECEYRLITAFIDKKSLMSRESWRNRHPYHFLMEILIEKYTQFLERKKDIGDIMPEGRKGKSDRLLEEVYHKIREGGTYYVDAERIQSRLRAQKLKFRYKKDNICGLQLVDLLAHPSHMFILKNQKSDNINSPFGKKVIDILTTSKYDRSNNGLINGYGIKKFT